MKDESLPLSSPHTPPTLASLNRTTPPVAAGGEATDIAFEGELFRALIEKGTDGIALCNADANITYISPSTKQILGYEIDEMLGHSPWEYMHPDDLQRMQMVFLDIVSTSGNVGKAEWRKRHKDGSYRWLEGVGTNLLDDPAVNAVVVNFRDITEKKAMQEALRESEQRFKAVADSAPVMIWIAGTDKHCNFYNKGWLEFRGNTMAEELAASRKESIHPDDFDRCLNIYLPSFDARKEFHMEYRLLRHDGEYRWISDHGVPRYASDGSFIGYIGSSIDITDRKAAAEQLERIVASRTAELREQKDFVEKIIDSSMDIISVVDADGRYLAVNKQTEEVSGKKREEMIGKNVFDIFPDLAGTETEANLILALRGQFVHTLMHRSKVNNRIYENFYVPIEIGDNVGACLIISHDNTFAIEVAEKLRETNRLLEERNKDLARSNSDLEQFAYIASHDLQEPLRKIRMFSDRLQEHLAGENAAIPYLHKIISGAERMSDLISDLLNYSRLSHPDETFSKTDLNAVLKKIIADFDVTAQEKKASIVVGKLPKLEAITLQMQQLFHNLISNSLKFSRDGAPPEIQISSRQLTVPDEIELHGLDAKRSYVMIDVRDNGIGFDEEYAEKIFIIFQRLNSKQDYKGTGIGLAICKKIIDAHGGKIFAESQEGKGATFHVILPLKQ